MGSSGLGAAPPGVRTSDIPPPRWRVHLPVVLLGLWCCYVVSSPAVGLVESGVALLAIVVVGTAWIAWLVASVVRCRRLSLWFAIAPLVGLAVFQLAAADVPLSVRWALSRPAFDDQVAQLDRGSATVPRSAWTGLYRVDLVSGVPGSRLFEVGGSALSSRCGFAYLPAGTGAVADLVEAGDLTFTALGDSWFTYCEGSD